MKTIIYLLPFILQTVAGKQLRGFAPHSKHVDKNKDKEEVPPFLKIMDLKGNKSRSTSDLIESLVTHIDPSLQWEPEACAKLEGTPKRFLKRIVMDMAERAHARGLTTVTRDFVDELQWMDFN